MHTEPKKYEKTMFSDLPQSARSMNLGTGRAIPEADRALCSDSKVAHFRVFARGKKSDFSSIFDLVSTDSSLTLKPLIHTPKTLFPNPK